MIEDSLPSRGRAQALSAHWRGHAVPFRPQERTDLQCVRRLSPAAHLRRAGGSPGAPALAFPFDPLPLPPTWIRVPILLGVSLLLVRFVAGLKMSQIGLDRWRDWNATEKSYFVQVIVIANVVFLRYFPRRPAADDSCRAFAGVARGNRVPSLLPLGFLSGGYVPRDSPDGARPPVGTGARDISSAILYSLSVPCTSTTSRTPRRPYPCSRGFSLPACSLRCYSTGRETCGWPAHFMASAMPISTEPR